MTIKEISFNKEMTLKELNKAVDTGHFFEKDYNQATFAVFPIDYDLYNILESGHPITMINGVFCITSLALTDLEKLDRFESLPFLNSANVSELLEIIGTDGWRKLSFTN